MNKIDFSDYIVYSKSVKTALQNSAPVLALESTVISHGLPHPLNLQLAKDLEQICHNNGVTPATICLHNGKIHIGCHDDLLTHLAQSTDIAKVSLRDFAPVLAAKATGATTVAATLFAAYLAGISVFATGGCGGVHRQAAQTFDISADLTALSRYPVILVSAGAKAILDLPATLQALETLGVSVLGWNTTQFPAFYSQQSGLTINKAPSAAQLVNMLNINKSLGLGGIMVANPVPKDSEIPAAEIETHIKKAIKQASQQGIGGNKLTPFLLSNLASLTAGKSINTNLALLKNNVMIGCQLAVQAAKAKNAG